jgi:hypothetical protein
VLRALVVGAALLVSASSAAAAPPLRVLYVGNSLTAANDLPHLVATLGARAGTTIEYDVRAPGGYALEDHWTQTDIQGVIAAGRYDWVVLQQGPSSLPESGENLRVWARTFADAARAAGGRAALYTVWPESYRRGALDAVIGNYRQAARDSGSALFPAGAAWKTAWQVEPSLRLYGADGFHPSRLGTYLAALVIYAGLTGTPAVGLPRVVDGFSVSPRVARILQRAAAAALRGR